MRESLRDGVMRIASCHRNSGSFVPYQGHGTSSCPALATSTASPAAFASDYIVLELAPILKLELQKPEENEAAVHRSNSLADLVAELQQWDDASDEDLLAFEDGL